MSANSESDEAKAATEELQRAEGSDSCTNGPRAATNFEAPAPADLSHIAEQLRPLAVPCADLLLDPANARRHPELNLEALKGSLRVYGQRKPLVVNRRTGIIEAGNGTLQAAGALGWTHLAVVYVDDDPMTATGFSIADNRTAELAEWDREALDKLLSEIKTNDPLLDRMLADLSASLEQVRPGRTDADDVPEPPDEPLTCPGDLLILGELKIDPSKRSVLYKTREIELTLTEFDILRCLATKPGEVIARKEIIDAVRSDNKKAINDRTIDVHVRSIRKKIPEITKHLTSVYGAGYRYDK